MRAIKIDVVNQAVTEIEVDGSLQSMYAALDVDCVTPIRISKSEYLWLDDNGLLREPPLGAFMFGVYPQALSGHGLIIGIDGAGNNVSTQVSRDEVEANVTWTDISELPLPVVKVYSFPNKLLNTENNE